MLWFAERDFRLRKPLRNGGTLGDAFALYTRKTRKRHPEDRPACDLPAEIMYLWEWFWEIAAGRPVGNGVMLPVPAVEIRAWQELSAVRLKPWEVKTLRALDQLYLSTMASEAEG